MPQNKHTDEAVAKHAIRRAAAMAREIQALRSWEQWQARRIQDLEAALREHGIAPPPHPWVPGRLPQDVGELPTPTASS